VAVTSRVDPTRRKVLSRFGAFVMRRAKSSIRKRKKVSKPGSPPSSRVGFLRKFIFFGYDRGRESVVIGPARLNGVVDPDALSALEHGGTATKEDRRGGGRRRIRVRARPFMGPALEAEKPELPKMWRDSIR
jgi:hypothetical protein